MKKQVARALAQTRLYHLYNRTFGTFDHGTISAFIHEYSRAHRNVFFLQVGANDGISWDPYYFFIRRDKWRGIVIEPQREVFEQKLKKTYQGVSGIQLMNVAVDAVDGSRPVYRYSFSSSRWATGLASFDKARLVDNFNTDYIQGNIKREGLTVSEDPDEYITSENVQCLSFETLLGTLQRDAIDFLITDVEGHDVPILDTFPLHRVRPANIVFELPVRLDEAFSNFLTKLAAHEYDILIERRDAIAFRRRAGAT